MIEWKEIDEAAKSKGLLLLTDGEWYWLGSWGTDDNYPDEEPQWFDNSYDDFSCGYSSCPIDPTHYCELTTP